LNRQDRATDNQDQGLQPESLTVPITSNIDGRPVQLPLIESSHLKEEGKRSIHKPGRKVSIELTEETIRRKTFSDTMQHPATMLPAAGCLIAGGYLLLLSPIFGGAGAAIVVASISGVAAAASYSVHYRELFQNNTRELTERFEIARAQMQQEQLNALRKTINAGFVMAGSTEGLTILDQLSNEYEQLETSLGRPRLTDPLSVSVIPALAEETYRRGLGVLCDTLDLMNVVRTPGKEQLRREIARVEGDIELLENGPNQLDRLKLKKEVLASLRERLIGVNRLELWVEQLLYQAQRCETTLQASRIELATVRAGSTRSNVDSVIKVLEERIRQVKEVQDEINRLGY
jgi:hypothetical protein